MADNTMSSVSELIESMKRQQLATMETNTGDGPVPTKAEVDATPLHLPRPSNGNVTREKYPASNQLLKELMGLQTQTNLKLDMINENQLRAIRAQEETNSLLSKLYESMSIVARNTIPTTQPIQVAPSAGAGAGTGATKSSGGNCKMYGFGGRIQVFSRFIMCVIKATESQTGESNMGSSRYLTATFLDKIVTRLLKFDMVIDGQSYGRVNAPQSKDPPCIALARILGATSGTMPQINANSILDIYNSGLCREMLSAAEEIILRMKYLTILLPRHEADIIMSLNSMPYFDSNGDTTCDKSRMERRSERPIETRILDAPPSVKETALEAIIQGADPEDTVLRLTRK